MKPAWQQYQQRIIQSPSWRLVRHFIARFSSLKLPLTAAGLAYYAIFSLGPILLLIVGGVALTVSRDSELARNFEASLITLVAEIFPAVANSEILTKQAFNAAFDFLQEGALLRSLISLLLLLWSASGFFTSLQIVLESIFEDATAKNYWHKRLLGVLLIFLVGVVVSVELVGSTILSYLAELMLLLQNSLHRLLQLELNWYIPQGLVFFNDALRFVIAVAVFTLCFRYLTGSAADWRGALLGASFSALAIVISKEALPLFFNLERFNLMYGIITSVMLILLWLYISLLLFLIGALIASEINRLYHPQS